MLPGRIARTAAQVVEAAQLLREGFSFQTGAGGISLAVASYIQRRLEDKRITGSFGAAGIKVVPIARLRELARPDAGSAGEPRSNLGNRIVAVQQYRDGSVIDVKGQVQAE